MESPKNRFRSLELLAVILLLAVLGLILLPFVRQGRYAVESRTCAANLKQWAAIFSLYAGEHGGLYPPVHGFEPFLSAENAQGCLNVRDDFDFCPDLRAVYPEYATDLGLLVCPNGAGLSPPDTLGPLVLQPLRVAPHALGILQRDGIAPCQYEGLVTNGDLSYTYFGWQLNYPATGGRHVNEGLAERLALPATGPAEVVAILAHLNRELAALPTRRKRAETLFRIRNNAINLRTIILSQTDLERLFPPRPLPGSRSSSNAPPVLNRLWAGWYFLEQEESGQTDLAGKPPPVRPWHATTPIMWDTVLQIDPHTPSFVHREPNGLNVLFMDGHVEFLSYPGKFPASESFATMRRVKRRY